MSKKQDPYHDESMWRGAWPEIFQHAKKLRNNETPAEQVLWEELRLKKLGGFRFRRQHPIQNYIADFYCHKAQLIIELDGGYHFTGEQQIRDKEREDDLNFQGMTVLRFSNEDVEQRMDWVLKRILVALDHEG